MIRMAKLKFFQLLMMSALLSYCQSQQQGNCSAPAIRWVRIGDMDLKLQCPCRPPEAAGSQSDFRVQWHKLVGGTWQLLHTEMGVDRLTIQVNNDSVGGSYLCECSHCCGKCFRVGVEPAIVGFTIQPRIARVGESLTLNCSAISHPAPRYEITKMGSNPNIPVGSSYEVTGVLTISNATVPTGGSYTCLVQCGFENVPPHIDTANANVFIYDPPKVVQVMNDTADPGCNNSVASLQCLVENTTFTHVAWFNGDRELHQSIDYSFAAVVLQEIENRSTIRFLLTVHMVSESDFGEYRCRIGSPYNSSEDEGSVWILHLPPPLPIYPSSTEPPTVKGEDYGKIVGTIVGVFFAVILFILIGIIAAFGIRALSKKMNSGRQQTGINEQDNTNGRNGAAIASNPRYVPPPLGATTETASINSASHDGNNMSFDDSTCNRSSSTSLGNNSRTDLLASPASTENGHLVTAAGSDDDSRGQFEGVNGPVRTNTNIKGLPPLEVKGLHRRPMSSKVINNAQLKRHVSPPSYQITQKQW